MEGSTAVESQLESTLYPKITIHIGEITKTLQWLHRDPETPEKEIILDPIPIVGTVKLHGTHADLLIHNDDTILLQSRNKTNLLVTADNAGFAAAMANKKQAILRLRDQYVARYTQLNADVALDTALPIIIAGEWIGEKIQKGVAISQLSKRLVIISANINGKWIDDTEYSDIESPANDIYNIARGGFYHATLYPQEPKRTADDLEPLAEEIAQKCPFAEKFGIKGHGEGLVWKLAPAKYNSNPILWFKTKGGAFKPGIAPPPKKLAEGTEEKREAAAAVAKIWCSEQRLEQGGDYLRERNMAHVMNNFSTFLKWVQRDIMVEEKGYIAEHGIDKGMLMSEVVKIARAWYESRI